MLPVVKLVSVPRKAARNNRKNLVIETKSYAAALGATDSVLDTMKISVATRMVRKIGGWQKPGEERKTPEGFLSEENHGL